MLLHFLVRVIGRRSKRVRVGEAKGVGCTHSDGVGRSEPAVLPIVQPARSWLMPGCVLPSVPNAARIERLRAFCSSSEEDPILGFSSCFSAAVSDSAYSAVFPCFHVLCLC